MSMSLTGEPASLPARASPTWAIVAKPFRVTRGYAAGGSFGGCLARTSRTSPQSDALAGGWASMVSSFRGWSGPRSAWKSELSGEPASIGRPLNESDRSPGIPRIWRRTGASGWRGGRPNRRLRSRRPRGKVPENAGSAIVDGSVPGLSGWKQSQPRRSRIVCSSIPRRSPGDRPPGHGGPWPGRHCSSLDSPNAL